ncbi:hypothetical protein BJV77DRAFT_30217 [Russula vinacea]|nr:hypothetical protein BJV77DRAFT_30217 [Russula vinacea]
MRFGLCLSNNNMSDVLYWIIPFLLFPLTASRTFATNSNESISSPRITLPPNAPYFRRDTNNTALNNITSNITSGSEKVIWIIQDTYNASNFFDSFSFFTGEDPTHGTVTYVDKATAFADNLSYISWDGKVIMQGDDTSTLQLVRTGRVSEFQAMRSITLAFSF